MKDDVLGGNRANQETDNESNHQGFHGRPPFSESMSWVAGSQIRK
jgi:hypothetical protein